MAERLDRPAVLVVDMLNDFITGPLGCERARAIVPAVAELVEVARERGVPVVYCNDAHRKGIDRELSVWGDHAVAGTHGAEVIAELRPRACDHVVPKRRYSGFFQTDLDLTLRDMGCEKVIVGGAVTNICVRGTVADAFQLDYEVFVPKDCVRATSEREQESQLWDFETHFATVCTSEELIAAMDTLEPGDECRIR